MGHCSILLAQQISPNSSLHSKQSNQNPAGFSWRSTLFPKCTWKRKGSKVARTILKNNEVGQIKLPSIKIVQL